MTFLVLLVVSRVTSHFGRLLLLVCRVLKVFELCLSSPQSHLFLLCFEIAKPMGIGSEPCFPPLVWLVGSVFKVGTTSVWRTLCPPGVTLGHVLASEARLHTAVLCVGMCALLLCMCMCVCVCSVPVCSCGPVSVYVRF